MKDLWLQFNQILDAKQKRTLLLLFLGSLFMAFWDTFAIAVMGPFTTVLTADAESIESSDVGSIVASLFNVHTYKDIIIAMSLALIGIYLVRGVARVALNFAQAKAMAVIRTQTAYRLFDFVMHQPYRYHLRHNTAETQRLVSSDVGQFILLLNSITQGLSSALMGLGIVILLLQLDLGLTLAILAWILLVLWVVKTFIKAKIVEMADINLADRTNMNKWVTQAIGNLKVSLVKGTQDFYTENYDRAAKNVATSETYYAAVNTIPKVLIDTLCMVLMFGVILVEVLFDQSVASALPKFVTYAIAALRLIPAIGQVTTTLNDIGYNRPAIKNIHDVLCSGEAQAAERASIEKREADRTDLAHHTKLTEGVELCDISFRFEDSDEDFLENVSLRIPANQSVAFVGQTGAGKTTLADIILGLQPIRRGKILADGYDVRENPHWWSGMLGYIPQSIYLLDSSVRENVAVGDTLAPVDDDWIWECLERAQMKEFVESLPQGLDTNIGENGIRLSGGQRQRIGIARALYARPQFLLMDEATSALDNETEKAIVDSINRLSGSITMLIIAHRLTTIENCDIIYRVENGNVTLEKQRTSDKEQQ